MIKSCPISNLRTCGALLARSFKFSTVSRSSGRNVLARGDGRSSIANLEQFITSFCAFVIPSGYRGLSCFAEHSCDRIPDHFQAPSPLLITLQGDFHVLKRSAEFVGDVRKSIRDLKNAER